MILSLWVLWRAIYTWLYLFIPRNHDFDERRNSHTRRKHSKLDLLITEKNKLKREPVMKTGRQFQFQSSDDTSLFDWWLFFFFIIITLKRKYHSISIAVEIEIRTVETIYYIPIMCRHHCSRYYYITARSLQRIRTRGTPYDSRP